MGSGPPPIGKIPPSPRDEEAAVELAPMAGAEAPAAGSSAKAPVGATEAPPALEEEEAGFLQLEVSNISSYTPLILRGWRLFLSFSDR
jgi:hypothetical protein